MENIDAFTNDEWIDKIEMECKKEIKEKIVSLLYWYKNGTRNAHKKFTILIGYTWYLKCVAPYTIFFPFNGIHLYFNSMFTVIFIKINDL